MLITTSRNEKLKNLRALYKDKKLRSEQGVFIVEGVTIVKDIPPDAQVRQLFIKESKYSVLKNLEEKFSLEANVVADPIFDSAADTVTPSGVIAVVGRAAIRPVNGKIALLLDGVSDAGNIGTVIRSAAARGIDTIVSVNGADMFSPKSVRASMGGIFSVNCIECDTAEALRLLSEYDIVALDMGGKSIYGYKNPHKIALAVGSEAHGLGKEIRDCAKCALAIPMSGKIESLNAAVSISIAMFILNNQEI